MTEIVDIPSLQGACRIGPLGVVLLVSVGSYTGELADILSNKMVESPDSLGVLEGLQD